jgi:GDP-D-mannose dehydratase
MPNDTLWTGTALDELLRDFGDAYAGRTVLVTGADGFMGSHLTDALVELGATVHAFVRATSSGALNNIGHLRNRLKVHFADLTDRTSVDYLVRELKATADDRPYVFHLGAQAHVGESWHRPYETVAANVLGSTGTSASRCPTSTTSTMKAASSFTSARRSTRSRCTQPRRSRPTS